jgi:glycosyltransferase involved in cell wall biosynthesis
MEKFSCKYADALIICEPERKRQITFRLNKEPLILPNIPEIENDLNDYGCEKYRFNNGKPTLVYFGGLVCDRFLEELLDLSKSEPFNLLIAGFGDAKIEKLCTEMSQMSNVRYFGKLGMEEGLKMTREADVVYAMYCKNNPNHIYAAPNKYYEAMFLGKPIISTKGTIVEDKILANNIGWVIEESVDDLRNMLRSITKDEIRIKGQNMRNLWNNQYNTYVQRFFDDKYSKIIK